MCTRVEGQCCLPKEELCLREDRVEVADVLMPVEIVPEFLSGAVRGDIRHRGIGRRLERNAFAHRQLWTCLNFGAVDSPYHGSVAGSPRPQRDPHSGLLRRKDPA